MLQAQMVSSDELEFQEYMRKQKEHTRRPSAMYLATTAQQITAAAKSCGETSWAASLAPETEVKVFSLPFISFNKKYYKCYLGDAPNRRRWVASIPQEWFDVIFTEGAR